MRSNDGQRGRRSGKRGPRRRSRGGNPEPREQVQQKKETLIGKIIAFFRGPKRTAPQPAARVNPKPAAPRAASENFRAVRKPEAVEVTSPKLYVGNLSYDAAESDLFELFKGIGMVQNAEIVTHKASMKSKGFGFVMMTTVDEARRAVEILHDKDFMGRKLVVSGAKTSDVRTYQSANENSVEEAA